MKIEIKLMRSRKLTTEGFPLVVEIAHQKNRKSKQLLSAQENHFSETAKTISSKHPDYDIFGANDYGNQNQSAQIGVDWCY